MSLAHDQIVGSLDAFACKNPLKENEIIDNAGVATAVIGLEAVRREQVVYDSLVPQARRGARRTAIRLAAANALRRMADGLEPSHRSAQAGRA